MKPVKVFYCYAREDEALRRELAAHLALLKRQGIIEDWCDRMISPGQLWEEEIDQRLEAAQLVLLLVSAYFLDSDYCYQKEMKRALERHKAGEAQVIPIILRPVYWEPAPFSKLQCLPKDGLAVEEWPNIHAAFTDIARGIRLAAEAEIRRQLEKAEAQRRAVEAEAHRKAAEAEAQRRAQEEVRRQAEEAEARRQAAEAEARRRAEEAEAQRRAVEAEAQRRAQEEVRRQAEEAEARRQAAEAEARRRAEEAEAQRQADKEKEKPRVTVEDTARIPAVQYIHGWSARQVQDLQRQTASALGLAIQFRDKLKDGSQGPLMVVIPGGRFLMGSPPDEPGRVDDERQHEVEVAPFAIGKYTVTFEEYDRFAEATQRDKPANQGWGRGRRPVINVSWHDAVAYVEWLSQQTSQTYRLPAEAEWEYACRAGTTTAYHFGTAINTDLVNYSGGGIFKSLMAGLITGRTVEVGRYPANAWSLHDMHGNVSEWTCSAYDKDYGGGEQRCAESGTSGPRGLRGGSWNSGPRGLRGAARDWYSPHYGDIFKGFRLARSF